MADPVFDPEDCTLTGVPDRKVDDEIDCEIPSPPDPINQCPDLVATPLIAGPQGPCPVVTSEGEVELNQLSSASPELEITTTKPNNSCAWKFDFSLTLPCPDVDIGAKVRFFDGETGEYILPAHLFADPIVVTRYRPGETWPPTMPNSGSTCANGFLFDFTLPNFCPTIAPTGTVDVQFGYTPPAVAIATARNPQTCEIALDFGFALPCPTVEIDASIQTQLGATPSVSVQRAQGADCFSLFDFTFTLPHTCPNLNITADATSIPAGSTPTVNVIQTSNRQAPNCGFNIEFSFGIPGQDQEQPSTPPVAIAYLEEEFNCATEEGADAVLYQNIRFAGREFSGDINVKPDTPLSTSGYYPEGTYVAVVMDTNHAWMIANDLVPPDFEPDWHVVSAGMHNARAILGEDLSPNGTADAWLDMSGYPLIEVKSRGGVGKKNDYITVEWDGVNCEWMCNDGAVCIVFPENAISDFYQNFYPSAPELETYITGRTPDGQAYWFKDQKAWLFSPSGCANDVLVVGNGWSVVAGEFEEDGDFVVEGRGGQYKIPPADRDTGNMSTETQEQNALWFDGYYWRQFPFAIIHYFVLPSGVLHRCSGEVDAIDAITSKTAQISGVLSGGVFFPEDYFPAIRIDIHPGASFWFAIGSGTHYFVTTCPSAVLKGNTVNLSVHGTTIVAVASFNDIDSGAKIGVSWDNKTCQWHIGDAECNEDD
jgi:hypothetical protein